LVIIKKWIVLTVIIAPDPRIPVADSPGGNAVPQVFGQLIVLNYNFSKEIGLLIK
jgi:hypothetical protein